MVFYVYTYKKKAAIETGVLNQQYQFHLPQTIIVNKALHRLVPQALLGYKNVEPSGPSPVPLIQQNVL